MRGNMITHPPPAAVAADGGPAAVWLCLSKMRPARASTDPLKSSLPVLGSVNYFTNAEMAFEANGDEIRVRRGRTPAFCAHWSLYIRGEHYEIRRQHSGSWPLYFVRHSDEKQGVFYMEKIGTTSMSNDAIAKEGNKIIVPGIYSLLFRNCQTTTKALVDAIVPTKDRLDSFVFPWDSTSTLQAVIVASLTIAAVCAGGYAISYLMAKTAHFMKEFEVLVAMDTTEIQKHISILAKEWGPEYVKVWNQVKQSPEFLKFCSEVVQGVRTIYRTLQTIIIGSASLIAMWLGYKVVQTNSSRSDWFLQRLVQWHSDRAQRAHGPHVLI